ncbi:MAG: hypothetical protein NZ992_08025 [Candidatus Korarchaeum sp.]|nr:hypothetical protein [Candidatus Korarchaeum sp.]MDW8035923.1 hypothetical protein [Candidatus Korarchaeum sp.]
MRWERVVILTLAVSLVLSLLYAFNYHQKSIELQAKVSESLKRIEELESSLNATRRALVEAEGMVSAIRLSLEEAVSRERSLRENLSKLQEDLSECLTNLSRVERVPAGPEVNLSTYEVRLSVCENRLRSLERASVHVAHWWYDSVGCVPCGTASIKFHVVLFNAGQETADNVRVVITLYDRANNPIDVIRMNIGSIGGRAGRLVERNLVLPNDFQRAEVRCEWD